MNIDRADVVTFLEKNANREFKAGEPCNCPIAAYLKQYYRTVRVGGRTRGILVANDLGRTTRFNPPAWVEAFIRKVDQAHITPFIRSFDPAVKVLNAVTGRQALDILSNIA